MNNSSAFQDFRSGLSRREFIRFFSLGLVGLLLPETFNFGRDAAQWVDTDNPDELLGRVTQPGHQLHKAPYSESEIVKEMEKDSLWRITGATVTRDDAYPNRIWYELENKGYASSRRIQPVKRMFNEASTRIPEEGCLGEITVPFVDAYSRLEGDRSIVYRFYYSSTFWVLKRLVDQQDSVWYQLLDDRSYGVFFVPAYYVRLVPDNELTPFSSNISPEDKKIVVDLSTQSLSAYEGNRVVFMSRISSGVRLREGGFATPKGFYRITRKRPCRHMANPANAYGSGFDLPGVPWVSYFTSNGVAFHGAYWHNDFGVPHSHGCINMTSQAAKWIYRWTTPTVPPENYYFSDHNGTRVIVQ